VRQGCGGAIDVAAVMSNSRKLDKEEIDGGNLAVPDDYEIGSGVSCRLARAARHPPDPTAIAYRLRRGERLILEVRMSSLDHACDAVDLVTSAVTRREDCEATRSMQFGTWFFSGYCQVRLALSRRGMVLLWEGPLRDLSGP
jgi:hypothetical protein